MFRTNAALVDRPRLEQRKALSDEYPPKGADLVKPSPQIRANVNFRIALSFLRALR
jgi:hypothetical protein